MEEIDVCLDCDGVLADFQSAVLNIVNELLDSNYQINDITDYYIQKLLPSNDLKNRFYEILNSSSLVLNLNPFEEAIEGVNKIKEIANIHIVTAPLLTYPNWIKHRNSWLQKYFKIDPKSVIHTHAKYMIFSDFFVDDKPENTGASYADDKTVIQSTLGLTNSSPTASFYMINNAVVTSILSSGVYYKVAGTPSAGTYNAKFTISGNRATYTGSVPRFFRLAASIAITAGNNNIISVRFAVDGVTLIETTQRTTANTSGRVESMSTLGIVLLNPGQYVELFIANVSAATNVTVTDLQLTCSAIAG